MMSGLQGLNWVDNVLIVILLASAVTGLVRGGVREIVSLMSWIAAYVVATAFSHPLAKLFADSDLFNQVTGAAGQSLGSDAPADVSMFAVGVAFILLFTLTIFVGSLIGRVLSSAFEGGGISFLNRLMGVFMGLARGCLASLVLIFIMQLTPMSEEGAWQKSTMVEAYRPAVQFFSHLVSPHIDELKKRVNPMATPVPLYHDL